MSEKHSLLQVSPHRELVFTGPFSDVVTAHMTLKNITANPVCFKVKTTAPKQYCVRPNSGLLKNGESKQITVMLQPLEGIPTDAGRHKFMVQSCVAPAEDLQDLESIWKIVDPAELTYSKLMVTFTTTKRSLSTVTKKHLRLLDKHSKLIHIIFYLKIFAIYRELGSSFSAPSSQQDGTVASLRKSLKSTIDEKEELQKKVHGLEQEIEVMLKKNRKLQQNQSDGALVEGAFPTLQVVLIAVAALLIGLIFGHLF
ncbi:Protein CBR-VPR-1 [Caenorhabditis briggsae]|uniref:Major sperm protein n=1 Tax=Caenorhabditis briggsae TaxID=6238 RepID=A8WVZ9_CAEBR|nr:Protein CBR-VPR-1 [Caenorhabditis briggsae]CAP24811.2 Protein CBR-VPR-1 [Caenorhabditis briggsae]